MKKLSSKQEEPADKFDYSKNEETIKYEQIAGTPFTKVWKKDEGWFLTMGNYQLTELHETEKHIDNIYNEKYQSINDGMIQIMMCLIDHNNKIQ